MKHIISTASILATALLLGCSTSQTAEPILVDVPPPEVSVDLPLEKPKHLMGQVCKLGTSCLEMDERPFEPCLTDIRHCVDKGVETLPAQGPKSAREPGEVIPVREQVKPR
jgi:hypothetical protein